MIRKLSLAVAVAAALSPMGAFALGLGEINSQSALNQKFKAEIDLLSVDQEEIQDIRVNLASEEAFQRAGIDRLFLLTGLRFEPMYSATGQPVIQVTSDDPIREPFLNFLLEVNWPKGRLVREFTVLLDPPVTLNRAPAPVSTPRVSTAPATRTAAAPARRPRPVPAPAPMPVAGGREYGPVQPNDNLWSIADGMRTQGESIEQVMMALQRHNADAFINNNVNNLKVGKVLRLPEDADVTSLSRQAARQEFLAQTRAWRSGKSAAPAPTPSTPSKPKEEDRLKLISAKPDAEAEAMSREGDAEVSRLEQEILLVRESNESALQENDDLRNRIKELEKQIEDIQRLVTLKSDELSQMQQAQEIAGEKMEQMEQPAPAEPAPAEPEPAPMAEPEPEVAVVPIPEGTVIEETNIEAVIEEAARAESATAEPPAMAETPTPAEPPAPAEQPKEPEVAEAAKQEPVSMPAKKKVSYFDNLEGNTTLLGIVGAVAVLLIGMLWMIMRRRKEAEAEFAESILVSPDSDIATAGKDDSDSLNEPSDETSFMSDFSPSDIDALQDETGEVDPLSEADVYIAYGRYQQAEELIKQAIERFPEREELKQKLLEIYFSAKKGDEYTKLAQELHNEGLESSNPGAWSKVASMGKELNPTHVLFAGAAGVAGSSLVGDDDLEDLGLDLGEDFAEISQADEPAQPEKIDEPSEDLDSMDLSGLDNLDEIESENLGVDMSLDSDFLDNMESAAEAGAPEMMELDEGDLELPAGDLQAEEAPADEGVSLDLGDSDSLDSMDLDSIERELEGLSEGLETEEEEPLELPAEESGEEISLDLDTTDEVTTKLDLARAYIDMGDSEGAKSILEEVVNEGNDQQKEEAQELINGIG